ncbi:MAG TPA: hypothetical protein VF933_28985 [Streptosporangiaceae bacterium]
MAATLTEILLAPETQPQVVTDCYELIDQQISEMSGVSGTAVKLAFKAVNTFMPGHAYNMAAKLLPDFVGQLGPYWADFNTAGGSGFGDYLAKHGDEVAGALLSVTDAKAASSDRPTVIKAYGTVRGGAAKHIRAALPRVGDLVQKYAA